MTSVSCAIALGSNLGDSRQNLEKSLILLDQNPHITVNAHSSWYQTKAVGPPQPDYLNGCALLTVSLSPHQLMSTLLDIEKQFHRVRRQKWGPRTLDLDLLLYKDLVLETPDLIIPHPRMNERAFVLVPLVEIAPCWVEPISQQTVQQLIQQIDCSGVQQLNSSG
ncbi:MAG: 2-amino-4-hydroxy-6-hydroxymethyldihydropteridine diphosphokinase [Microcystaceae cyanobacterium]